jgi:nicotinamide phosphoribosyltransferase
MGGALLQKLNRDTQQFAIKCSEVTVEGKAIAVYKDPITDPGKASKQGRLALIKTEEGYQTVVQTAQAAQPDELAVVFEDGYLLQEQTFDAVRQRAEAVTS